MEGSDDNQGTGRRAHGWAGPAVGGLILIFIGVALFAGEFGVSLPDNWWALLLLIPAVSLGLAATRSSADGDSNARRIGSAIGALIFTVLAFSIFGGIDAGLLWPTLLVLLGIGAIVQGFVRNSSE